MRILSRPCRSKFQTCALAALFIAACRAPYPPPPETEVHPVAEKLHGVEFTDPYRWLEDQDSPETRAWIDRQNAYAESIIGRTELREAILRRLGILRNTPELGGPSPCEDHEYFSLRRRGEELPAIYRRTKPEIPSPIDREGDHEIVLASPGVVNGLTTRVSLVSISSDCRLMIYSVRRGGEDEVELRIRDLETGADLDEHFERGLYSSISFAPDNRSFLYSRRSRRTGARILRHRIGSPVPEDPEIFGDGIGPDRFVSVSQAEKGRYEIFTVSHGWSRTDVYLQDMKTRVGVRALVEGENARFYPRFIDGTLYMRTNLGADNNRLLAIDPLRPGRDHWKEVIAEGADVMTDFQLIEGKFYVSYLHNVGTRIRIFDENGAEQGEIPVPGHHRASIRKLDEEAALLTVESFTQPRRTVKIDLQSHEQSSWENNDVDFDPDELVVKQVWFDSRDGTRIPMYVLHRSDLDRSVESPTLLTGYGGFNVALGPRFDPTAILWAENGGVFAMANLRGGSEFGERWHRGGMLENKQNVFDDFIGAAEWLLEQGYTNPSKLAIRGGSNGGLLVASAFTQRPELFRAVLCGFPDLDMVRFYTFTETNNLPALHEYGNAALPEQFEFLRQYSPYQQVRDGVDYPAVMLTSGDRDTRVPPLQARKMTARLQAASSSELPVILRYHPEAGHAAGRGRQFSDRLKDTAAEMTFLFTQLGLGFAASPEEH